MTKSVDMQPRGGSGLPTRPLTARVFRVPGVVHIFINQLGDEVLEVGVQLLGALQQAGPVGGLRQPVAPVLRLHHVHGEVHGAAASIHDEEHLARLNRRADLRAHCQCSRLRLVDERQVVGVLVGDDARERGGPAGSHMPHFYAFQAAPMALACSHRP